MQPTLRQTPPICAYRSPSTTFKPKSAALKAAVYPPGPAPSTKTSQLISEAVDESAEIFVSMDPETLVSKD